MSQVVYNNVPVGTETEEASGLRSIILTPEHFSSGPATLDEACAIASSKSDDQCLNYERVILQATVPNDCALVLTAGTEIGQHFEVILEDIMASLVISISVPAAICVGSVTSFDLTAANNTVLLRWNGESWNVLSYEVG